MGAQAAMEVRLLVRSSESLLVTFGIPLGVLVFFSLVEVLPIEGQEPVDFLVPGVLAISVVATGVVAIGIQTAFERKYGVLKRLGGTPLGRAGYLVAKAGAVAAMLVAQTVLV
ncbi:MAG: ABC transporter permease, partial [Nitriliruptoraceae bacterium]